MPTLPDRGPSQIPFILTAFGLLTLLALLVFLVFRLASADQVPETELIEVPNVVGMTEAEAADVLRAAGFRVELRPEASEEVPEGIVIHTSPTAGTELAQNEPVLVYVSAGTEPVLVPNVIGMSQEDAEAAIEEAGLAVGTVTTRPDTEAPAGEVIEQAPLSGVELPPGTAIDLVVSEGPEEFELPDLSDIEDNEAFQQLADLGLRPAQRLEASDTVPEGIVIRTEPEAGTLVLPDSTVTLVISSGAPPVVVPDVFGATVEGATGQLNAVGLAAQVASQTVSVDDPALDQRVVMQTPAAGASVDAGTTITITVGVFTPPTTTTDTTAPPTTSTTT
jgi:serine/threonine-protein kinase